MTLSVQPEWCRALPLQQQSVMLLAARGPDGVAKVHPCKGVVVAYRACVLVAAKYGRELRFGERADSFMSLGAFAEDWVVPVQDFMDHKDALPFHYVMHLLHGAEILSYKHPDGRYQARWEYFYKRLCSDMHLTPETEAEMDKRLSDWNQEHWT